MSDSKAQRLANELDDFIETSPNVEAAAVVSFDGLTMASALPEDMDDDRVGAMSAALLSLGEQAARGLGRGDLSQIFVEAAEGFVFLMSAKDEAVLVAVTDADAKIGFILYEMRRAAHAVGDVLASRPAKADNGDGFAEFASFADGPAPPAEVAEEPEEPAHAAFNGGDHQVDRPFEPHVTRSFEPHVDRPFEPRSHHPFESRHQAPDQHDGGSSLDGWR